MLTCFFCLTFMFPGSWLPVAISDHATAYDVQLKWTLMVAVGIFAAAHVSLVLVAWRFRAIGRESATTTAERNSHFETVCTLATALLFLGLLALGGRAWAGVQFTAAPPEAEIIEVLAKQFAWSFRYAGPDGRFGRTGIRFVNDAGGNPFGLDPDDAAGKDDIVSATLRVPSGRPIKLMLNSLDVIHSFFVRELRLKQDSVPGMRIPVNFVANVPGAYEIPCAELCGLGHFQMRATMVVMAAPEYDKWRREATR